MLDEKFIKRFNELWKSKCSKYPKLPNILPAVRRIIVLGDIHGDYEQLIKCLKIGGVINTKKQWIGEDTVVVQVGDQIDSCRFDGINHCHKPNTTNYDKAQDVKILKFLTSLHKKAQKKGGAVYSLVGNHELMNVDGDMSYASYKNIKSFDNYKKKNGEIIKDGLKARKYAFAPGNDLANFLACTRQMALIIGSNLFVHAGIVPDIARKYNVDDLNKLLTLYLLGELKSPHDFNDIFASIQYSPLWNRIFGNANGSIELCEKLMKPLEQIWKVGKIFVGHTPQISQGIVSLCDNRINLTDFGLSRGFDKYDPVYVNTGKRNKYRNAQVLEILYDEKINVLK